MEEKIKDAVESLYVLCRVLHPNEVQDGIKIVLVQLAVKLDYHHDAMKADAVMEFVS